MNQVTVNTEKITQTFINALTEFLTDGWRVVDFRPPSRGEHYLNSYDLKEVLLCEDSFNDRHPRIIVEKIPLAGKAWAEDTLSKYRVTHFAYAAIEFISFHGTCGQLTIRSVTGNRFWTMMLSSLDWEEWDGNLDNMSDGSVTWLYQADEKPVEEF